MDLITELKELGADTAEAVERCMNKPELYERLLKKVPANLEKLEVLSFLDAGDNAAALTNAHTIKGIAGNLSLTPMFGAYTEIVKATPHNYCRAIAPQIFSLVQHITFHLTMKRIFCTKLADCTKATQAGWRPSSRFCAI